MPSTSSGPGAGMLITTSKDTSIKLWDLSTQHCIQTVVAHRAPVWTMDLEQDVLLTGTSEGELKAWRIDQNALLEATRQSEATTVRFFVYYLCLRPMWTHLI
jgi:U3 small nucleolar RNA-associated protein 12